MAHRLQVTALCLLALALCASATSGGYYYGGHRRLREAQGFGRRELLSTGYYYGGSSRKLFSATYPYYSGHRRLQESAPMFARPLFGDSFLPAAGSSVAADIPVPHFLSRQLQSSSRQLTYYYGSRRLQGTSFGQAGRSLTYYYGSQ